MFTNTDVSAYLSIGTYSTKTAPRFAFNSAVVQQVNITRARTNTGRYTVYVTKRTSNFLIVYHKHFKVHNVLRHIMSALSPVGYNSNMIYGITPNKVECVLGLVAM